MGIRLHGVVAELLNTFCRPEFLLLKKSIDEIYMEGVTLPTPPEGYEYILRKKVFIRNRDPSELTPRQLATLKYREKNREKILEHKRLKYQKEKESNLSKEEDPEVSKSEQNVQIHS